MVTKKLNIETATATAETYITTMADMLAKDPAGFATLEADVKAEVLRIRKNQAVIKILSGKNVNEKTYADIATVEEVVASGLTIVKGTKKAYDAKKEVVVDVVKYDSPAAIAMRDAKKLAAVDEVAVIEGDIYMGKMDNRLDHSTAISTQVQQIAKAIRKAKREAHVVEQEAALAKKTAVRRSVAELAAAMGF